MKKLFYFVAAVCSMALVACDGGIGNQPEPLAVSHDPSNKNVVIEEFTGVNCGYCPEGHAIVNKVMEANPGRVFGINVHCGSYAAGTYTTEFGTALMNEAKVDGFPSGTVNRHSFSGTTCLGRGQFEPAAKGQLSQPSPLNLNARATINKTTRHLKVEVSGYYTADANSEAGNGTNKLNIAILQDNVMGRQSGMSGNPDYVVDGQYRHMHMLRHLVTGQWGEDITPITAGSEFFKTYEYDIPEKLGVKAIDAVLEDLRLVVFMAEGHQEIITACECPITFVE